MRQPNPVMNPVMEERFVEKHAGTVTDQETGLMWSRDAFGKDPFGKLVIFSEGQGFNWTEATERFGRARKLQGPFFHGWASEEQVAVMNDNYQITTDTYQKYKFGRDIVTIGGFDDWRLPTLEEYYSLVSLEQQVHFPERYDCRLATSLFGSEYHQPWIANNYGWLNNFDCTWYFEMGMSDGVCGLVGDSPLSGNQPVRFVRGGKCFNTVAFPPKAFKNRNRTQAKRGATPTEPSGPVSHSEHQVGERRKGDGVYSTEQRTSKTIKARILLSVALGLIGIIVAVFGALSGSTNVLIVGAAMVLIAVIWSMWLKFRRWWEHG